MPELHPQAAALLARAARSTFPPYHTVAPHVARRIYHDTRSVLAPRAPEVAETRLLVADGRVALRAYRPLGSVAGERLPALVFFHGGGWTIGDLDTHDGLCRELANGAHCAVVSVDYRLAPEAPFPAAVLDCLQATRYVFEHAEALQVDGRRIAVGGDSAGGNLAAVVALHWRDAGGPPLAFQLLVYPATDQRCETPSHGRNGEGYLLTRELVGWFRSAYAPQPADWLDWRASPLLASDLSRLPPALVLTAGFDPLLDEGRAYAERLRAAGVDVRYREYADMIHGFLLFGGVLASAATAVAECCAALRGALHGQSGKRIRRSGR